MIEKIVALCLFLGGEMIEHSPKESLSECLETKRKIERNTSEGGNSYVKCSIVKAKVYVDKFGIKRIEEIKEH
jgi:hypothetical protein